MASEILKRDENHVPVVGLVTDDTSQEIRMARIDDTTKGLKVMIVGGGTTSLTVGTTTIASGTTTRILYDNAGVLGEYTISGSGTVVAMATSPVFTTPTLGVASATTINKVTITAPATSSTLTIADGKTLTANDTVTLGTAGIVLGNSGGLTVVASKVLTVNKSITLDGTDSTTMTFPSTSATIARTDAGQTFTGVQVMTSPTITTASLNGANVLAENASIQLDPAGSADGKFSGITVTGTGGATIAFGDLLYLDSATSRWKLTDADAATTSDRMIAMAVSTSTDGTAVTLLLSGIIRADAKFPALTIGSAVYVGETAGEIQVAIPTGADNVIRRVGYALTADEIYFNPSMDSQITVA